MGIVNENLEDLTGLSSRDISRAIGSAIGVTENQVEALIRSAVVEAMRTAVPPGTKVVPADHAYVSPETVDTMVRACRFLREVYEHLQEHSVFQLMIDKSDKFDVVRNVEQYATALSELSNKSRKSVRRARIEMAFEDRP